MMYRWLTTPIQPGASSLARELGINKVIASVLINRGYSEAATASRFINPRLSNLADPFLIPGMKSACERIARAIQLKQNITLFGDYDVDGVTSLAFLKKFLSSLGTECACFIPKRLEHGYGLSLSAAREMYELLQPELLISVDCGTNSTEAIGWLKDRGVDTVVVDHHEPQGTTPQAVATVNPKLDPTGSHTPYCSAGLVFKLAHAMLKHTGRRDVDIRQMLDIVAVGTVADIVPLTGENRIITAAGLSRLANSNNLGLRTLLSISGIKNSPNTSDIGFRIGPRINAAGRLANASLALELLLTTDPKIANEAASELDARNRERQQIEDQILREALEDVQDTWSSEKTHAIVVARHDWHPGVVGIVASRIQRRFWRPTFVIALDANGMGKGSGRSVEGVHLVEALATASEFLEQFGGHEMAAGLSVRERNLPKLRDSLNDFSARHLTGENRLAPLRIDAELLPEELQPELYEDLQKLQPFGQANPEPLFLLRRLVPAQEPRLVGRGHTRLALEADGVIFNAIMFGSTPDELPRPPWDIAGSLQLNDFFEEERIEMRVTAVRQST